MKIVADFILESNEALGENYGLLKLRLADSEAATMPEIIPGQFAQVRIDGSKTTFLRRPISICSSNVDEATIELLVRRAGAGTAALLATEVGARVNLMLPLGRGFMLPRSKDAKVLLAGGGVGVAPLYALGVRLKAEGYEPEFMLGARSARDLLLLDRFESLGTTYVTTDDGSAGTRGVVTAHARWQQPVDMVYCCGPKPMMAAVAKAAQKLGAECEVSLENMMACGLGACLCCVEKTVRGNVCVCTEGPVFNIKDLTWFE